MSNLTLHKAFTENNVRAFAEQSVKDLQALLNMMMPDEDEYGLLEADLKHWAEITATLDLSDAVFVVDYSKIFVVHRDQADPEIVAVIK